MIHVGCGGYTAVVCLCASPSPFLPLARLLPAAPWASCLPFPRMPVRLFCFLSPPLTARLLPRRNLKLRFAATRLAQLGDDGCGQGSEGDVILDGDLLPELCTGKVSVYLAPCQPIGHPSSSSGPREDSPVVPAACSLTAWRSLTKAFSPALGAGELMKRRWTAGERRKRGAERMICRWGNIFGGSGGGARWWTGLDCFR